MLRRYYKKWWANLWESAPPEGNSTTNLDGIEWLDGTMGRGLNRGLALLLMVVVPVIPIVMLTIFIVGKLWQEDNFWYEFAVPSVFEMLGAFWVVAQWNHSVRTRDRALSDVASKDGIIAEKETQIAQQAEDNAALADAISRLEQTVLERENEIMQLTPVVAQLSASEANNDQLREQVTDCDKAARRTSDALRLLIEERAERDFYLPVPDDDEYHVELLALDDEQLDVLGAALSSLHTPPSMLGIATVLRGMQGVGPEGRHKFFRDLDRMLHDAAVQYLQIADPDDSASAMGRTEAAHVRSTVKVLEDCYARSLSELEILHVAAMTDDWMESQRLGFHQFIATVPSGQLEGILGIAQRYGTPPTPPQIAWEVHLPQT